MTASPERAERLLWQALADDKRALALFLGAGAAAAVHDPSGAPLIPTIAGVTEEVTKRVSASADKSQFDDLVRAIKVCDGRDADVEDLLTWVRMLRRVVGESKIYGLDAECLERLESLISAEIAVQVSKDLPSLPTPFDAVAAWTGRLRREAPIQLFTTNYDLLIEQALERARVPYFDGFVGGHRPFLDVQAVEEDRVPARWVRLWKLHGSVHWEWDAGAHRVLRTTPQEQPTLIHPSHLKYDESRRGPYLIMQDRLRAHLKQPCAVLVTIGYRFGDHHLNEIISEGVAGNSTAAVFALLHSKAANYPEAFDLAKRSPNLFALAHDSAMIASERIDWDPATPFTLGDFVAFGRGLRQLLFAEAYAP